MKFFEIDQAMRDLVDPETGELLDYEAFEQLTMEREEKIDNMILWIKELDALAEDLTDEAKALTKRAAQAKKTAGGLRTYLALALGGKKHVSVAGEVRYLRSTSVEVDEEFIEWAKENASEYISLTVTEKPDKVAIKEALKRGDEIAHAALIEKTNLILK